MIKSLYTIFLRFARGYDKIARKSIFEPKGTKGGRIEKAVEHDMGKRTFGRRFLLERFDNRKGEFSKDIEVLLNSFVLNSAKVLAKMDIQ